MKYTSISYKEFTHGDCVISVFRMRYLVHDHWVEGFLAVPKGAKKLPCMIYNRGGSFAFGEIDDHLLKVHITKLASLGYVVIASQYSGNGGSKGKDEVGGEDIEDVLMLKECLLEIPEADESRIGMFGGSRGGMMALLALRKVSWIKAAVILGAMTNLDRMLEFRPEMATVFEKAFGNT
ncbi:hypothetical protein EBT31_00910, partial [bacterium]|nr:hypothetical protein [bacterium]